MQYKLTLASFLDQVKSHKMEILHDQGVYRHLRFSAPTTNMRYFELITGPGYLLYRGDMGVYEFERMNDMFTFFFTGGAIAPNYWGEKLRGVDPNSGFTEFDIGNFETWVWERVGNWLKSFQPPPGLEDKLEKNLREAITEMLESVIGEETAYAVIADFTFEIAEIDFPSIPSEDIFGVDFLDTDFKEYTYRYLWCCYAITWGVNQYKSSKR